MAKDGAKKAKLSKKARRKAARRRRLIRDLVLYLCLMALCIGCLALMPLDAPIAVGDGVCETAAGEPEWLCVDVRRWSAHLAASLARRVWP